mmetsp:Transcript_5650/g.13062  ORF Transcript_5650/g.13062 Transcript_5650/m.13062 type:complete len:362 (+) Transcript_5650:867-1952(+)
MTRVPLQPVYGPVVGRPARKTSVLARLRARQPRHLPLLARGAVLEPRLVHDPAREAETALHVGPREPPVAVSLPIWCGGEEHPPVTQERGPDPAPAHHEAVVLEGAVVLGARGDGDEYVLAAPAPLWPRKSAVDHVEVVLRLVVLGVAPALDLVVAVDAARVREARADHVAGAKARVGRRVAPPPALETRLDAASVGAAVPGDRVAVVAPVRGVALPRARDAVAAPGREREPVAADDRTDVNGRAAPTLAHPSPLDSARARAPVPVGRVSVIALLRLEAEAVAAGIDVNVFDAGTAGATRDGVREALTTERVLGPSLAKVVSNLPSHSFHTEQRAYSHQHRPPRERTLSPMGGSPSPHHSK